MENNAGVNSRLANGAAALSQGSIAVRRMVTPVPSAGRKDVASDRDPCRDALAAYQARLRVARNEFDKLRRWLEARALRLDGVIGDLDLFLESLQHSSAASPQRIKRRYSVVAARSRPNLVLSFAKAEQRGDGYWDIQLDNLATCRLSPLLGRLFTLLSEDTGHEVDDGLVGFKSNAYVLSKIRAPWAEMDRKSRAAIGRLNARGLAQAIYELRGQLAKAVLHGDALIQTRRGVGRRVALRKPTPPNRR